MTEASVSSAMSGENCGSSSSKYARAAGTSGRLCVSSSSGSIGSCDSYS
jgi:hypothetical protein